jgi:hypothetical protein
LGLGFFWVHSFFDHMCQQSNLATLHLSIAVLLELR